MAPRSKIKSFQFVQSLYLTTGTYTPETKQYGSFSRKGLITLIIWSLASFANIAFQAKSIGAVAFSYSASMTILTALFYVVFFPAQIPNSLSLFEKFDEFIQKSELKMFRITIMINNISVTQKR